MILHITYYSGEGETLAGVKRFYFIGEDGHLKVYYENDIYQERYRVNIVSIREG